MLGDDPKIYTVPERLRGYARTSRPRASPRTPRSSVLATTTRTSAEQTTRELLGWPTRRRPCSLATTGSPSAPCGRSTSNPTRVALIGFDDLELAEIFATPLSVIAHDPARMGEEAASYSCGGSMGRRSRRTRGAADLADCPRLGRDQTRG